MRARPRLSLKARAIALLAQREHSRLELRRKLLTRLREDARADALAAEQRGGAASAEAGSRSSPADGSVKPASDVDVEVDELGAPAVVDPAVAVDELLDWLEAHDYLSASRFVESRVNARAARFGTSRIRQELAQHGVTLEPQALQSLKAGEFERARAVWQRKFGTPAAEARERARQARFLAARGFSGDVIRRVVSGLTED